MVDEMRPEGDRDEFEDNDKHHALLDFFFIVIAFQSDPTPHSFEHSLGLRYDTTIRSLHYFLST